MYPWFCRISWCLVKSYKKDQNVLWANMAHKICILFLICTAFCHSAVMINGSVMLMLIYMRSMISTYLTIALCPIVAGTATIFRDVDILRVIEIGKWWVHYRVDHSWLQIKEHSTWNIMLIVSLTFQCTSKLDNSTTVVVKFISKWNIHNVSLVT